MKKVVSMLLVLVMMLSCLAGCGGNDNANNEGGDKAADTFYIGGIGPTTGGAAI